jgi:hypothetical protein
MIDIEREICKPILKLDFKSHGIIESLSEFGQRQEKSLRDALNNIIKNKLNNIRKFCMEKYRCKKYLNVCFQVTNIFSNCDSTIMGNSSNKEKDKEINGINIPKVPTFPNR